MAKILIVEDDHQLRDMLAQFFQGKDYEVITSANGVEALRLLESTPVDLIITDIIMPDKDGMGLIRELRCERPDAKIIAISGGARHIDPKNPLLIAEKLGASCTFTKPFKLADLLEAVQELV